MKQIRVELTHNPVERQCSEPCSQTEDALGCFSQKLCGCTILKADEKSMNKKQTRLRVIQRSVDLIGGWGLGGMVKDTGSLT